MKYLILFFIFFSTSLFGDPWGTDACLCQNAPCQKKPVSCHTPFLNSLAEKMIAFHQNVISPADGPRSHFLPSSSQYTLEAIRRFGFVQGCLRGCDRLMRENNDAWVYRTGPNENGKIMKLDPLR
jgi:putative component of membrane protein insertase Oxa1/YidC/SpoIIIJ protein YidD